MTIRCKLNWTQKISARSLVSNFFFATIKSVSIMGEHSIEKEPYVSYEIHELARKKVGKTKRATLIACQYCKS